MRMKLLLLPFIILFLTLLSVGNAFAALRSEPVPRAQFDLRGVYNTDLFNGSGTYSYQIPVPKGTADLTPDVSISYNSSSTNSSLSFVGMGWDISRDYIERDGNYSPGYTGDDKFKLR